MESSKASLLDEAIKLHRTGAIADAIARYRQILRDDASNADAQYYLAVAFQQQGDIGQALQWVRALLAIDPQQARAHKLLGLLQSRRGDHAGALASYDRAIACGADVADLHGARGDVLVDLGRLEEAVASYDRALALQPAAVAEWCNRGAALYDLARYEEALASHGRALALQPNFAEALYNQGNAYSRLDRHAEALESYDRALAIRPNTVEALNNRGNTLLQLGRLEEALSNLTAALAINPRHLEALVTCGTVLYKLGRPDEALACCDRALAIKPDAADALSHRATALLALDRYEDALTALRRILAVKPDDPQVNWNVSILCLVLGQLEEGWKRYDARWTAVERLAPRGYRQPQWTGEAIEGTLLVWGEQGLGDQIIYAGMMNDLTGRAGRIVVEVEPRLVPLFARSFPDLAVVPELPEPQLYSGQVDAQIALGSLGGYLRRGFDDFPRRDRGYLIADPARTRALRERLAGDGRRVIGLSWISRAETGRAKSALLSDLELVLQTPNCRFVDLQYGDTLAEREAIERMSGYRVERLPDIDTTLDIDGLAALISACDAVVTVSNTTAHLAGALGTPTWVVVPYGQARIWYWFRRGADSPWYPRVRVLRQQTGQRWRDLFATAATELRDRLK